MANPSSPESEQLLAHWDFLGGTGEDLSGNGHDATAGSGASFTESGVNFDGTADGVLTIPYSRDYQPELIGKGGRWRVELTGVVPTQIPGRHQAVISARANTQGWIVYLTPSGEIEFWMRQVSGDDYWAQLASGVTAEAGRSYDITGEWDGVSFSVSVTGSGVGNRSMEIGDRYQPMAVTEPLRLGAGGEFGDEFFYSGSIASVSIRAVIGETEIIPPEVSFFGSWDNDAGDWLIKPRLDYLAAPTLVDAESAAKSGDYATAQSVLHEHFQDRTDRVPPSGSYSGVFVPEMTPLFLDNIWTLGTGEIYQDVVALGPSDMTVSADVSEALVRAFDSGASFASFFLMARRKSPTTFTFRSRTASSSTPVLEVTQEDGSTVHLLPVADTYIIAGENSSENYGDAPELLVRDEGSGPFGDTTAKAYLTFDFEGLTGEPSGAVLRLTGAHDASGDREIIVFQTLEDFDETERTWDNTVQNTYSWQGDPGGFDWLTPPGADVEYGYQIARFNFAVPLIEEYRETGDEDIAKGLLELISDFIADGDSYPTPYGAGSLPRSLDTAARIDNWIFALEYIRSSEVMSADDLASMIRTLDKSGQFLSRAFTGTPNWLTSQMSSLTSLGLYFPELTDAAAWLEQSRDFLSDQLSSILYPDGGFVESSSSYAYGTASTFIGLHVRFREAGYELDGLEELRGLVQFLADQNYPDGYNPAYGDSDVRDRSGSLEYWAEFLDDATIAYRATGGTTGSAPSYTSAHYPDTRVVVLRSDWTADANYLRINADIGNHSHPDDLAISLFAGGRELIPETGTFTYSNDPRAEWLRRETEAQSTIEVDGTAQALHAEGGVTSFSSNDLFDLTRLWTDANPGVRHTRTMVFLRPGAWLVGDHLVPKDEREHTYRQNWHFLPDAAPEIDSETSATITNHDSGPNIWIVPADNEKSAQLRNGYYSSSFYSVQDSTFLSYELAAVGPIAFDTLLLPISDRSVSQPRLKSIAVDARPGEATAGELVLPTGSGTYCLVHDFEGVSGPVRFGDHRTDAMFTYVEQERQRQRWVLHRGTELSSNHGLISSPVEILDIVVDLDPSAGTVTIVGSNLVPEVDPASAVGLRAPWAKAVTLNGDEVHFEKNGPLIYAAAVPR